MTSLSIFTDAATSSMTETSIGGFLYLENYLLQEYAGYNPQELAEQVAAKVIYKCYPSKKSTWSEIRTVIEALNTVQNNIDSDQQIIIYTDCQSFCDLIGRRKQKLLENNFITKSGKVLQNAELYKELFSIIQHLQIKATKIKGHALAHQRITIEEKIFALLDKLTRQQLRSVLNT